MSAAAIPANSIVINAAIGKEILTGNESIKLWMPSFL